MRGAFSLTRRLRGLVILIAVLMLAIAASCLFSLMSARDNMLRLSTQIAPAFDANSRVLQVMTNAETGLRGYAAYQDPALLTPYRGAQSEAHQALADLDAHLPDDSELQHIAKRERRAVDAWWQFATRNRQLIEQGGTARAAHGADLFDRVRATNGALHDRLAQERTTAREHAQHAIVHDSILVGVVTVVAIVIALGVGFRVANSLSGPLTALREVVSRQRAGDTSARADDSTGALDVRALAADFNDLSGQNEALQRSQSRALAMHQLTLDVERAVRSTHDVQSALNVLCRMLGEGMNADRVMANTIDENKDVLLGAQWHDVDLDPLPDIPEPLVPEVGALAEELWQASSRLVLRDFLDPEVQAQERARLFYRETGAQSLILVPIGLGERVIGIIYVLAVDHRRHWTRAEANTVQQSAAFVAQVIVETQHQEHQAEHVARLEQLDRQKTDFLSTVSHELRTPLTSISGYLELLLDGDAGHLEPAQERMLAVIDRNTTRLRGLIDDLLLLNRIETGRLGSEIRKLSLCQLLDDTAEELRPLAGNARVHLDVEHAPDTAVVMGDRVHLQRAMVNVLSNAIKFTPVGGSVTVRCTVDEESGNARIVCRDTGIGIPEKDRAQLFTRFYRASNATEQAIPGTGLGLVIVRQIVEDHHGQLQLSSVEGQGTTLQIDLPLAA
ncbi:MAG TPA: ATP-binding protein, partial [Segeticoccus sp.]|uniref:ATP-binding protein n=1 Tax=Segeticoccus sp. TaxID=2706531 RepID=UPI002D7F91AA